MTGQPPHIDKARLAIRFGYRAGSYDAVTPVQAEMAAVLVGRVRDHFSTRRVTRVLELGCGTGRMTRQLAAAFPEAEITALDISADMIHVCLAQHTSAMYIVADAETFIRETRNTYDLIISNAAVQWFENADATLNRARDLLAPKGLLMVSTFGNQTFKELSQAFSHAYAEVGRPEVRHVVAMRTVDVWCRAFPEASVSQQFIVRTFPDVRQFLRSVQEAGAVNSMSGQYFLSRDVLSEMNSYYTTHFSDLSIGHINATYHVVYIQHEVV